MDRDENADLYPSASAARLKRQRLEDLDLQSNRKRLCKDPFMHHGKHFGRTVEAFCKIGVLLGHSTLEPSDDAHVHKIRNRALKQLLQMIPGLEDRLTNCPNSTTTSIARLIQKGCTAARSEDARALRRAVLDWITPRGEPLVPPLVRGIKDGRGFLHDRTGALLCPAGLDWSDPKIREQLRNGRMVGTGDKWPIFIYRGYVYNPKEPWDGLFRSCILVSAYKYIFTSPSSTEVHLRTSRPGNAQIHGMTKVTPASVAYIAFQIQFALSSFPFFVRADSERFYYTIMELFNDVEEQKEVKDLLAWWNEQIFPNYQLNARDDLLARNRIKERRAELRK